MFMPSHSKSARVALEIHLFSKYNWWNPNVADDNGHMVDGRPEVGHPMDWGIIDNRIYFLVAAAIC
jgi:hypothetical protein